MATVYEVVTADDLIKAGKGAGSRGGHVIGKTRSGKPIYSGKLGMHLKKQDHRGWSPADHRDAARLHTKKLHQLSKEYKKKYGDQNNPMHVRYTDLDEDMSLHSEQRRRHLRASKGKYGSLYKSDGKRRSGEKYSQYKVRMNMHEMKKKPSKYPGGRKQAIAIGLNQAREEGKKSMTTDSDLVKCADPMVASSLSTSAYEKSRYEPYGHKGHAEAARAHMAAAFYNHHAGNEDMAKDHLKHAEHHHEEAEKSFKRGDSGVQVVGDHNKPTKSMSHKFVDRNLHKLQKLVGKKRTPKSLFKAMIEERENQMDDIEAIFKSEAGEEEKMIEIDISDAGDGSEVRLVSLSEIKKSLKYMSKGKKRHAKSVAQDNTGGRKTVSGDTSSKRSAPGVPKEPKQSKLTTTNKSEGGEESSEKGETDVKKGGEEKKDDKKRPPVQILKGNVNSMVVIQDNTETGDEAIAKAIEMGLGQGNLPSMRNRHMEKTS